MAKDAFSQTLLREYIKKREFLKFRRTFLKNDYDINGYLVDEKGDFLLICHAGDFLLDGYVVILKSQVKKIELGKFERTLRKIFKAEGILNNLPPLLPIDLGSWQQIFNSLKKHDYHAQVECEQFVNTYFDIGAVMRANKDFVRIQKYNANGEIYAEPAEIPYEEITTLSFLNRYSVIFRKYIK